MAEETALETLANNPAVITGTPRETPLPPELDFPKPPGLPASAVTQVPSGGSFRVDQLSSGTQLVIADAAGRVRNVTRIDPAGRPHEEFWFDTSGVMQNGRTSLFNGPLAATAGPGRTGNVGCGTWAWYSTWHRNPPTVSFGVKSGSIPASLGVSQTASQFVQAAAVWTNNTNWCGLADNSTFTYSYAGYVGNFIPSTDGIAVVGFQSASYCPSGALACAYIGTGNDGDVLLMLNRAGDMSSAATTPSDKYDVRSIAVHELGHTMGFGHNAGDQTSIMFPYIKTGDFNGRQLGRGDGYGNNEKY